MARLTMFNKCSRISSGKGLLTVWAALLLSPLANANNVTVDVAAETAEKRLGRASVCLGTPANATQFGARLTDAGGKASFTAVPNGKVTITISKDGYRGHSRNIAKGERDTSVYVPLRQGGGGPECIQARVKYSQVSQRKQEQTGKVLRLYTVRINNNASQTSSRNVKLNNSPSGKPSHYRASEKRDFSDAQWQEYSAAPSFTLSNGSGNKTVYFQVRKIVNVTGGEIARDSYVVSDVIRVR